jgi:hypothetical protein
MKLSIVLETDPAAPQSGTATRFATDIDGIQQRDLRCDISANFVAQLAATFLRTPQTRVESREAMRTYDEAAAPKPTAPGTMIFCTK